MSRFVRYPIGGKLPNMRDKPRIVNAPVAATVAAGILKYWTGSTWDNKPVKYWTGGAWDTKPVKRWTGSAWV